MMKGIPIIFIIISLFAVVYVEGHNEGFIYGTVKSWDGKTFSGQLRWGKEEAFWTDMFNASKTENEFVDLLSREDFNELNEPRSRGNDSWWDRFRYKSYTSNSNSFIHQFTCQFGNLASIERKSGSKVVVTLRNGTKVKLSGSGYNDIGATIRVYERDLGKVEVDWDDVEEVIFSNAPGDFTSSIGAPLYGTVESWNGTFEGLIQWDKDERVTTDVLDGDENGRDLEIEFGNIKSIERRGRGVSVELKSGRMFRLDGSNDVDDGNRGIVITNPEKGRVVVNWEDFEKATFSEVGKSLKSYSDFSNASFISGTVNTENGESFSGRIVYDLDEAYGFEILNGEKGDTEFEIPFELIKQIKPMNSGRSIIVLKTGDELPLEDTQDVAANHTGMLVYDKGPDNAPIYIPWKAVQSIDLK